MRTLIVYSTKHGTTEKCAALLSKKLSGQVELKNLKVAGVADLTQYDSVIVGGSIYAGRIQKEVSNFCSQNIEQLKNKKLGLFICCMNKNNAQMQLDGVFPKDLLNCASAKDSFGGEMRFSQMNFAEKFITKMVTKADPGFAGIDTAKDFSMISEESISKFANVISNS